MSFKGSNIQDGNSLSNPEIKSILLNIYDRLTKPSTKEVGYELFLKLILNNLYSTSSISFILSQLSEFIPPLPPKEKEPCLKLLSLIFFDPIQNTQSSPDNRKNTIYYQYLSSVLSIIQSITKDSNNSIFPSIANTYAEIVQNVMPTDISFASEELNMEEKRAYEMLQGFCIYNMKLEEKSNRIIGSLCLTKLVENCPIVLQEHYMKFIWDNIINFIETKNYTAKYELLNCLISLILGAEGLFAQYANATLYKVLDFLTEDDWNKRKLALNVIYTLIFYCKDEIMPLKEHIINFLRVLKTDKVKEVREVCLLILQIFNENEPVKKKIEKEKSIGSIINKNKINKNTFNGGKKENKEISQNPKNKSRSKAGIKLKKNNNFFENNKKFSKNPFKDNSLQDSSENRRNSNIKNVININDEDNNKKTPISLHTKASRETNTNTVGTGNISSHNKSKSKKSNNFVNEKMVIKPDPNKSIFKAIPNQAFFGQRKKNNNDIVVLAKGKPIRTYQNNNTINNNNSNKNTPNKNNINYTNSKNNKKNKLPLVEKNNINYVQEKKSKSITIENNNNEIEKKVEKEDLRYKNMFNNDKDNDLEEENINLNNIKSDFNDNDFEKSNRNNYDKENRNENEGVDQVIMQKLLAQMDFLTKGHTSLINMFDNIQMDTQEQIENLNENFEKLESKTNRLNKDLNDFYINGY